MVMINVNVLDVQGFAPAIKAMRNPKNSWGKSDSIKFEGDGTYVVGDNDLALMKRLFEGGVEHRTYLRMIQVWMDIEAPLYWWKEMDRYTVGKNQISTSTMHKLHAKELTLDDFSHEYLDFFGLRVLENTITALNDYRDAYIADGNKKTWMNMIQLLPSSYNQKRTVNMSYETVVKIIKERSNHKLDEWVDFCGELMALPYITDALIDAIGSVKED